MALPIEKNEKGIALILVLWVLALLSVIVGEFCYAMRTEVDITRNFKAQTEAYYIALAGLNRAIGELVENDLNPIQIEPSNALEKDAKTSEKTDKNEEIQDEGRWRVNVDMAPVRFGGGTYKVRLDNESGKININGADETLLKMMMDAFDIDEQQKDIIVDSILDWRDEDNLHRVNGAEDEYYRSLSEPYECKDGYFDTVEELLMVRGVTPELFYGGIRDIVSAFKPPKGNVKIVGGFKQYRTNVNKINMNAAPKKVLVILPSMTEELVKEIVNYRQEKDFKSVGDVCAVVGQEVCKAIGPYITLEMGPFFDVKVEGTAGPANIRRGMDVVVEISQKLEKGYRIVQWCDFLTSGINRSSMKEE
jgi:general secretion pathway protein K